MLSFDNAPVGTNTAHKIGQELENILSDQDDGATTQLLFPNEGKGLRSGRQRQIRPVLVVLAFVLAFIVGAIFVRMKLAKKEIQFPGEPTKILEESAVQKMEELMGFLAGCREHPTEKKIRKTTVELTHEGVKVFITATETAHQDNWPSDEILAKAREQIEAHIDDAVQEVKLPGRACRTKQLWLSNDDKQNPAKMSVYLLVRKKLASSVI